VQGRRDHRPRAGQRPRPRRAGRKHEARLPHARPARRGALPADALLGSAAITPTELQAALPKRLRKRFPMAMMTRSTAPSARGRPHGRAATSDGSARRADRRGVRRGADAGPDASRAQVDGRAR
jgi:hypothetical protein